MRVVLTAACAAAALLALAGCKKAEEKASAPEAAATAGDAGALPNRKAGLWTQVVTVEGGPSMTNRICLGADTDAKLTAPGQQAAGATCSKNVVTKSGEGFSYSSTCTAEDGGVTKVSGAVSGDFSTIYNVASTVEMTGAQPAQNRTAKVSIAAKWTGPCPEGWLPGDLELPGGTRVNSIATLESLPK